MECLAARSRPGVQILRQAALTIIVTPKLRPACWLRPCLSPDVRHGRSRTWASQIPDSRRRERKSPAQLSSGVRSSRVLRLPEDCAIRASQIRCRCKRTNNPEGDLIVDSGHWNLASSFQYPMLRVSGVAVSQTRAREPKRKGSQSRRQEAMIVVARSRRGARHGVLQDYGARTDHRFQRPRRDFAVLNRPGLWR